jgi:hypothetical protein
MAAEVARAFWAKLGGEIERGRVAPNAKKAPKVVAEAPEDDESAPDAGDAIESKAKVAGNAAASERQTSPDGDGGSGRDEDKAADENVLREEASAAPSPSGPVPPTFDAFLAPTGTNRAFVYHQDISPMGMRPYTLPLAAATALHIAWYPVSALTSGPLQHLGVEVGVEQAFGLRSAAGADGSALAGKTFGNSVHDYEGGLRYRVPFGAGHQIWLSGTAGEHAFVFTNPSGCADCRAMLHIPDTVYRYGTPRHRPAAGAAGGVLPHAGRRLPLHLQRGRHAPRRVLPAPHRRRRGCGAGARLPGHAQPRDPRVGPAAPLFLRHAFEGR